jgi:hypothetical protein
MTERLCPDRHISRERIRITASLMAVMTIGAIAILFLTAQGTVDFLGRPIGTDFSNVWTAGWLADHGRAADVWDWRAHYAVQQALHQDAAIPFYGWHYPPPFLLLAVLLAQLPYIAALILWQGSTLAFAFLLIRQILPKERDAWLAAIGAPVVLICLAHGQNAFLTASLLGGGMLLLDRRPWIAGILLGTLVYKPQFAVLIPVLIAARGNWRAFAAAGMASVSLCLLTFAIWGWPVWQAFLDSLPLTRHIVIESGNTGWEKIPSPFSAIRQWGGSVPAAYAVQGVVTFAAIATAALITRRGSVEARGGAVLSAALLCTPYVLDYDFVLLGVAIAFLSADMLKRGELPWERTALAYAWVAPLFGRWMNATTGIPVDMIAAIAVLFIALRRAVRFDGALANLRSSPCRHSHAASGQ